MFYFSSRSKARIFAAKSNRKVLDCGRDANKRWAVQVTAKQER